MRKELRDKLPTGGFGEVAESTSRTMAAIRGKKNRTTETKLRMALVRHRVRGWKVNYRLELGRPDFYFPRERVAVFTDGCFWHGCPKCGHIPTTRADFWETKIRSNAARDQKVTSRLLRSGIVVLRFWEHHTSRSAAVDRAAALVAQVVKRRRSAIGSNNAR